MEERRELRGMGEKGEVVVKHARRGGARETPNDVRTGGKLRA